MPQTASEIKERIISFVKNRGPKLPVHIAGEVNQSILFTSAFLSELFSEKMIKMSNMRVGSSPVYFLQGQEPQLEKFAEFLKSKEKEAFNLLKEKKFLEDSELEPAIRVALREIKDFAIPFKKNEAIFWKYLTADEKELEAILPQEKLEKKKIIEEQKKQEETEKQVVEEQRQKKEKQLEIFDKAKKEKTHKTKTARKKTSPKTGKQNEKFLEKVKEFLSKSSVEIINIEGLKKDEITLKIKVGGEEQLLVAYNKKKISEKEIIKAAKKAVELGLKYSVLSLGELPKKISELILALKDIKDIGKVE
ncbi:MAG: hypothetical protein AABX28_02340 [Nanoarchaeota archaeon]